MILKSGYLKKGIHRVYYATYGNPKGKPWIVCHGGPGSGSDPSDAEKFDLNKNYVILFDQRGCGKSTPTGEMKENNTSLLVEDMVSILDKLKVPKVNIYGGSWGTTLALVFAIRHPERVFSLVLKSVFLGRKKDLNALFVPNKNWSEDQKGKYSETIKKLKDRYKLKNILDGVKIVNKSETYYDKFCRDDFSKLWTTYEILCCNKGWKILDFDTHFLKLARVITKIEINYFKNNLYLKENYILSNIKKIENIPVKIIHGSLDMVCPKDQALDLAKHLKDVELYLDEKGGHSSSNKMKLMARKMINR